MKLIAPSWSSARQIDFLSNSNEEFSRFNNLHTCDFYRPSIVHYTITGIKSTMNNAMAMQIFHTMRNVGRKRKPEGPSKWDFVVLNDVRECTLRTIVHQYAHMGDLHTSTHKLTQIMMPQFSTTCNIS